MLTQRSKNLDHFGLELSMHVFKPNKSHERVQMTTTKVILSVDQVLNNKNQMKPQPKNQWKVNTQLHRQAQCTGGYNYADDSREAITVCWLYYGGSECSVQCRRLPAAARLSGVSASLKRAWHPDHTKSEMSNSDENRHFRWHPPYKSFDLQINVGQKCRILSILPTSRLHKIRNVGFRQKRTLSPTSAVQIIWFANWCRPESVCPRVLCPRVQRVLAHSQVHPTWPTLPYEVQWSTCPWLRKGLNTKGIIFAW